MGGPPPRKREDLKPAAVAPPWGQVEASRHPAFEFSSQLCSGASSCPQFQAGGGVGNPQHPAHEFSTQVDLGFSTPSPANLPLMINLSAHDRLPCMTRLSPEPSVCFRRQLMAWAFPAGLKVHRGSECKLFEMSVLWPSDEKNALYSSRQLAHRH